MQAESISSANTRLFWISWEQSPAGMKVHTIPRDREIPLFRVLPLKCPES